MGGYYCDVNIFINIIVMPFRLLAEKILLRLFYGPRNRYQPLLSSTGVVSKQQQQQQQFQDELGIVSLQRLSLITSALPMFGFIFCIFWSLMFNFVDSTSTHCGVAEYLPSVSASIGSFSPQKYLWRTTIALHSSPRYIVSYIYYRAFHDSKTLLMINWIEISALLGLSVVSSTELFLFHANCFLLFISASFLGMLIHLLQDKLWSKFKMKIFFTNTFAWIFALFFYVRHNNYCETGVYSLFAASEYVFVLTNILFHFQAYYDFNQTKLSLCKIYVNSKFSV
ncbi:Post-GPI attachment to proteins factor 2 [Dermatophagoides farinae]|uniref:Post-GPI attachment to proteins factor 2 n=1 Tax=Dermatophagoides farinae TaxID=6954 RepID=A0A922HM89_DERFA|nr:Post-GPI attachment to proteins factor 2 [Dermatophagoides farinae]